MRILFFFVHPSKYHLFKYTINYLKTHGHTVDIAIISKDVLEELVKNEGWEYTNIFPEGRRSKSSNKYAILWSTGINFFKTVWRLHKYTKEKKYDLFITDDCLSINGKLKRIHTFYFQDDDLIAVPENALLLRFATRIVSPIFCNLGKWNNKKINYLGNHELAYLHPNYFSPDIKEISAFNPLNEKYFILRLVSLTASHDINKKGLNNNTTLKIINLLEKYGKVYITNERTLPPELEKYRINIPFDKIAHALYYANMYIGDSQTMTSEAAILGTPAIRFNDFVGKISYLEEEENVYGLTYGFKTNEFDKMYRKIEELINTTDLKEIWRIKREKLLNEYIDVTAFLINVIENYKKYI